MINNFQTRVFVKNPHTKKQQDAILFERILQPSDALQLDFSTQVTALRQLFPSQCEIHFSIIGL